MAKRPPVASRHPTPSILETAQALQQLERPDLAERVSAAAARLRRPSTVVCVVGEFKQGKSSLVNALLGQNVCPVDDDLATSAITLVRWAEEAGAVVRRKADVAARSATTAAARSSSRRSPSTTSTSG